MSNIAVKMDSMGFNRNDQVLCSCSHYFFYPLYNQLNELAEKTSIVPWISPAVGVTVAMAKLIQAIGFVVEVAIKGMGNLAVGVPTLNADLLKKGSLQLVMIPFFGIAAVPLILFSTLVLTKELMSDPEKTTKREAEIHQNLSKKFCGETVKKGLKVEEDEAEEVNQEQLKGIPK